MQQTEPNAFINTDVWKNYKTPINQKNKSFSKCLTQVLVPMRMKETIDNPNRKKWRINWDS